MTNYIERTKFYYAELGYKAYKWASFLNVPFTPLKLPLVETRVTLITTAAAVTAAAGNQGPKAAYNANAKFFSVFTVPTRPTPDLRISHLNYDRVHCAADDPNTWLPITALLRAEEQAVIGRLAEEVICLPTNRSQRATIEQDCPAVVAHCQRLNTDVALLVPT